MFAIDSLVTAGLKILDKCIPDPAAKAEAQQKLLELQQNGELKLEEFDVRREEIAKDDRDSARNRQAQTKDSVPTYLASVTIVGFFVTIGYILSGRLSLTGEQGILVGTIVGYVSAKADQVLSYYFGSSSSSKKKDDTIHMLTK